MDTKKRAEPVTLAQLHRWLKDNNHLTWNMNGSYGPGAFSSEGREKRPKGMPIIKYVRPYLDMRTGTIYFIETEGCGKYVVDFREEFNGNLLELLKHKIDNKLCLPKEQSGDDYVHDVIRHRALKALEEGTN